MNRYSPLDFLNGKRELLQGMLNSFSVRFLIAAFCLPFVFHFSEQMYMNGLGHLECDGFFLNYSPNVSRFFFAHKQLKPPGGIQFGLDLNTRLLVSHC